MNLVFYLIILAAMSKCGTTANSLFSILWLLVTFLFTGFLIYSLTFTFLGVLYILIYVGGLTVLFLFAIMFLN